MSDRDDDDDDDESGDGGAERPQVLAAMPISVGAYREINGVVRVRLADEEGAPWPAGATIHVDVIADRPSAEPREDDFNDGSSLASMTFTPPTMPSTHMFNVPVETRLCDGARVRLVVRPSGVFDRYLRFELSGALVARKDS